MIRIGLSSEMPFGKHRGRSVRSIILGDPGYITWGLKKKVYKLTSEAEELYHTRIGVLTEPEESKINPMAIMIASENEKGNIMNKKVVLVVFDNTMPDSGPFEAPSGSDGKKNYSFFTDLNLEVGDLCVADCDRGIQIVRVTKIEGLERLQIERADSWIISKIDVEGHKLRLEKQAKAQEILNKLDEGVKQMERVKIYQTMATHNPEMGQLMRELHSLDPDMMPSAMIQALPNATQDVNIQNDEEPEVLS